VHVRGRIDRAGRAGVGAVATQAIAEPAYGRGVSTICGGRRRPRAGRAQGLDPMSVLRQVGVVGADGSVAGHG
jgi:uncharacterized Ntn-hydrolase superfamily protein